MIRATEIRRPIMVSVKKHLVAAVALGLALSALASPSFAQRSEEGGAGMSAARAQAIHECNAKAGKYIEHTWGDNEVYIYRSCMAEHGQPE
jgi:hypothetical protein